jgi:hypothetical protein
MPPPKLRARDGHGASSTKRAPIVRPPSEAASPPERGPLGGLGDAAEVTVIMCVVAGVYLFFAVIYLRSTVGLAGRWLRSRRG